MADKGLEVSAVVDAVRLVVVEGDLAEAEGDGVEAAGGEEGFCGKGAGGFVGDVEGLEDAAVGELGEALEESRLEGFVAGAVLFGGDGLVGEVEVGLVADFERLESGGTNDVHSCAGPGESVLVAFLLPSPDAGSIPGNLEDVFGSDAVELLEGLEVGLADAQPWSLEVRSAFGSRIVRGIALACIEVRTISGRSANADDGRAAGTFEHRGDKVGGEGIGFASAGEGVVVEGGLFESEANEGRRDWIVSVGIG